VLIHDNLDSEFNYLKLLLASDDPIGWKDGSVLPSVMQGLPRTMLRSGCSLTFLLFYLLPPIYAYIAHHWLVHAVGYAGMWLLLRRLGIGGTAWLSCLLSLGFGAISYYHVQYGISIAGQPLLLAAFLGILHGQGRWHDWGIILSFPFFSFLAVTLPFFLPLLLGMALYLRWVAHVRINPLFFAAMGALATINVMVEFPLIYATLLHPSAPSHRSAWELAALSGSPSLGQFALQVLQGLRGTHYHAGLMSPLPALAAFAGLWLFRRKGPRWLLPLALLTVGVVVWAAANKFLVLALGPHIELFRTFNSERLYFLSPFLWTLLLAGALQAYDLRHRWQPLALGLLLLGHLAGAILQNEELVQNAKLLARGHISPPTFRQFYDRQLFEEVKHAIGPDYREQPLACLGIFPSIPQYHGLYTLDSYQNNYPLAYKEAFRPIIAPTLERVPDLKTYFDAWGSRCYLFSESFGKNFMVGKQDAIALDQVHLDFGAFRDLGGRWLLTAKPIEQVPGLPLALRGTFTHPQAYWELSLYEVLPE
jgi:hypothetical protein